MRYAVLVHPGDAAAGNVARRFEDYLRGTPPGAIDRESRPGP